MICVFDCETIPDIELIRQNFDVECIDATLTVLRREMVGVTGVEPATSSSRTMRATRLRHTPTSEDKILTRFG